MRFRQSARRALTAESLESRICLSAVRVVTWNTENGPDGSADEAFFSTVLEAIGNESVQGNTIPPSIIALQETDNLQDGGNSIARVDAILESLYPSTDYSFAVSMLDSGDDANGFVYDSSIFDLISTSVVQETPGMQSFAHNILRGQFRPIGTSGQSDFYIYSTHLKAGASGANAARRAAEANAIRVDIDALGSNEDVLVMGDFNIAGSSEGAYQNFLFSGDGQLFDPIDRPGEWKNNSSFVDIHTQNPEINGDGGMDDRYDFQIASASVFDNEGLQYIEGSYHAFGNNGTHTYNSDITTGTGASPAVLAALAAASDHLPVVVDYEIDFELAGLSIVETNGSTVVIEEGSGDSYSVVLDSVPTGNVTVSITTDGQTTVNGTASTSLLFTPGTALDPQTVSVAAVNDSVAEGEHSSQITHTASSSDPLFNTLVPSVLTVSVLDDDVPSVVVSELMYNPASNEPDAEWVEIVNLGPGTVDVSGWSLDDEDSSNWSAIPAGTTPLNQGDVAVIHSDNISSGEFRAQWGVPASAQVIGVAWGSLANSPSVGSEILELLDSVGTRQDLVNYDDDGTNWPADNNSSSIYLTDMLADNNVGSNWDRSSIGIDGAVNPSGLPFDSGDVGSPGFVPGLDVTPPTIVETRFDDNAPGDNQRSTLRRVTVVFDQIVQADESAFELVNRSVGDSEAVDVALTLEEVDGHSEAILTFSGNHVNIATGSLLDGNYLLTVISGDVVSSTSGVALDGDSDGLAGGDALIGDDSTDAFFRLYGDTDGNRVVDNQDLGRFGLTYLKSSLEPDFNPDLDSDGDGDIDSHDYSRFRMRLLRAVRF